MSYNTLYCSKELFKSYYLTVPNLKKGGYAFGMGNTYAYVRVSTKEQNEGRQLIAMEEVRVPKKNIYIDKQSGKDFARPMYQRMLEKLKENDLLYIKSIDRLGRDYQEILDQWRILTKEKKIDIVVLDMPLLDTRKGKDLLGTFIADLVLALLSYVSENERHNIRSRQKEGIEAAKMKGTHMGRPQNPVPKNFIHIYHKWLAKEITAEKAASLCNLTTDTFYRRARKQKEIELLHP